MLPSFLPAPSLRTTWWCLLDCSSQNFLAMTSQSQNDFYVISLLIDSPSSHILLPSLSFAQSVLNFFLLKAHLLCFLEQGWGHQFSQTWRERFLVLVPSLPSFLLRCEYCLQVQQSDLPTKAGDNLMFLLGRLNFVQAPAQLPKHISSLCFSAFRKVVQFILLFNSCGHIAPVAASGPLIPTLPGTSCL